MLGKATYSQPPSHNKYTVESKKLDLESGVLGRFFGSSKSAASSISWIMIFLFTCAGLLLLFASCVISFSEYWKTVGPFVTLALGYLFGRKTE